MVILRPRAKSGQRYGRANNPTLGGGAPPVYQQSKMSTGHQPVHLQDPNAPPPVTPSAGGFRTFDIGNLAVPTIGTTVAPGGTVTLPNAGDIFQVIEDISETWTGTVTPALFGLVLDHYTIADATGAVVWNQSGGVMQELTNIAFLNPQAGGSLGGTAIANVNSGALQNNVAHLAGYRLPASRGPWKFTPYYNTLAGSGNGTTDTVALRIGGHFASNVGGVTSYYVEQSNLTLNAGFNYFNQFAAVKNRLLAGMFINGITTANVSGLYIEWNGKVIEPQTYGNALVARQNAAFPGVAVPASSLILANPVLKGQFPINDSSMSYINMSVQGTGIKIGYYYLA